MEFEVLEKAVTKLVHFKFFLILQCHFTTAIFVRLFAEGII